VLNKIFLKLFVSYHFIHLVYYILEHNTNTQKTRIQTTQTTLLIYYKDIFTQKLK